MKQKELSYSQQAKEEIWIQTSSGQNGKKKETVKINSIIFTWCLTYTQSILHVKKKENSDHHFAS